MKQIQGLSTSARRSKGLTLVELLVSLTIGIVLMLAVIGAYLGSVNASASTQAQSRMNEDAQAALGILTQHIRMTGNNPKQPNYAAAGPRNPIFNTTTWAIRGCDGKFDNMTASATVSALNCAAGGGASLAVVYEADSTNTVAAGGNATDCLGQTLPGIGASLSTWDTATASLSTKTVTFTVADNRFYIDSGAGSAPSLYCLGNGGGTPQPLVENIEDMQIEYGVAPSNATGTTLTVAGYLTATTLLTSPTLAALATDRLRWEKVATVRVCLIVRSDKPIAPTIESAAYFKCDGTKEANPPDQRLRRAYTTTIVLRNRVAT